MNDINPRNIDGANVTAVGRAGGPVNIKEFSSGSSIAELSIAVSQGYRKGEEWVDTGTAWYKLTSTADYAADNWPVISKGDKVRVDNARLEVREYTKSDGSNGTELKLSYGDLSVVQSKSDGTAPAPATDSGWSGSAPAAGVDSELPW